jgi:hypothetical protein
MISRIGWPMSMVSRRRVAQRAPTGHSSIARGERAPGNRIVYRVSPHGATGHQGCRPVGACTAMTLTDQGLAPLAIDCRRFAAGRRSSNDYGRFAAGWRSANDYRRRRVAQRAPTGHSSIARGERAPGNRIVYRASPHGATVPFSVPHVPFVPRQIVPPQEFEKLFLE